MPRENISLSKDGISTPLITFMSAYAASIIVVAFLVVAYYFPVFGTPLIRFKSFNFSTTNKIFIGLLIFALLQPFGIILDVLGWMLLGWLEKPLEIFHYKTKTFFTKGTKEYLNFEDLKKKFCLTKTNFYEIARDKEYIIYTQHPDLVTELDFPLGASILLRNLTVCSITILFVYLFMGDCKAGFISLTIIFLLILMNSCISFFHSLSILRISLNIKPK